MRSALPVWKQSGPMLSAGCAHVGPSRAHVEPSGPSWAYIGPGWAYVGLCWAHLGPICWAHVGLCWPMWPHVEPSWELCWGHVWAIFVETILRCRPTPPPGAQNHVKKNTRFCNIAKMKSLAAEGPETP